MTTHKEALKLALDALEQLQGGCTDSDDGTVEAITVWCPEVIDAIKEALAQPEHVPDDLTIAYMSGVHYGKKQRTWVRLTDDEIDQGLLRSDYAFKTAEAWRAGVVFAMTKLKQKNGYDS